MKSILTKMFTDTNSRLFHITNDVLAVLTVISIITLILETVSGLSDYTTFFLIVEWVAVIIFTVEYIGRAYMAKPLSSYTLSFFGIVDLLAILPTFIGLGNFVFLKSARALRIIRLLRMLRLAKMSRSVDLDDTKISLSSLNIMIYMSTLIFALLMTGTAMYLVEPNLSSFQSIPAGMWWSFKVFLASIPVTQPETIWGEFFYIITRFTGLCLLGLLISVVGNVFREMLEGKSSYSK